MPPPFHISWLPPCLAIIREAPAECVE